MARAAGISRSAGELFRSLLACVCLAVCGAAETACASSWVEELRTSSAPTLEAWDTCSSIWLRQWAMERATDAACRLLAYGRCWRVQESCRIAGIKAEPLNLCAGFSLVLEAMRDSGKLGVVLSNVPDPICILRSLAALMSTKLRHWPRVQASRWCWRPYATAASRAWCTTACWTWPTRWRPLRSRCPPPGRPTSSSCSTGSQARLFKSA